MYSRFPALESTEQLNTFQICVFDYVFPFSDLVNVNGYIITHCRRRPKQTNKIFNNVEDSRHTCGDVLPMLYVFKYNSMVSGKSHLTKLAMATEIITNAPQPYNGGNISSNTSRILLIFAVCCGQLSLWDSNAYARRDLLGIITQLAIHFPTILGRNRYAWHSCFIVFGFYFRKSSKYRIRTGGWNVAYKPTFFGSILSKPSRTHYKTNFSHSILNT